MRKYSLITIAVLAVIGIFYSIFAIQFIRIYSFDVDYHDDYYRNQVVDELNKTLNEKYLKFIPKNNLLTYSGSEIKNITKGIITDAKEISVHPENFHTIKIKITEYNPAFRLSNSGVIPAEAGIQVSNFNAMSDSGIIYDELDSVSGLPLLIISTSTKLILDKNFISNILDLKEKTDKVLFVSNEININEINEVTFKNKELNQTIIFKADSDFNKLWSTLISAIDTDPLKEKLNLRRNESYYINLTTGNKVFYKWTNDKAKDIIATSTINNIH